MPSRRSAEIRARLLEAVRAEGGVVRASRLLRDGYSQRTLSAVVQEGQLLRVRRRWVAVPEADPFLLAAARSGVVLSCVTAAERLGLWVLDASTPHVAAPPHSGRIQVGDGTRVHRALPLMPRHPDVLVDPIENVLALVASCQPYEAALAVWESALHQKLVDPLALARLPLKGQARDLIRVARAFADSGLESIVLPRLRWLDLRIVPQAWIAGHRVDFLIGDRLVLQIDGKHHVGRQREIDIRHDAELMLMGYHVIRVGYFQVINDWPGVQHLIMQAVAQGLHRAA